VFRASSILLNGNALRFQSTSSPLPAAQTTSTASDPTSLWPSNVSNQSLDAATDLTPNLDNVTEHIGYLKELGLDYGWGPTAMMEWIIEHIHVYAGTPWWGTIAITAILVRAAMFYGYIGSADNAARMATVAPLTKPLYEKMRAASGNSDTTEVMRLRQELQIIQRRAGIKLMKSFVPLLQVPVGYGSFMLLRGMAKLPVPGLETGGILWFQNLAIPDPFFLLPIATAGVLHLVLRVCVPISPIYSPSPWS
jgi:YidC/Oxa1 family membrane protein insertase